MNVAKYDQRYLEQVADSKPPFGVPLRLPCPASCGNGDHLAWCCDDCGSPLKYCRSEQYIYCACGRCPFADWSYRCADEEHGAELILYNENEFVKLTGHSASLVDPPADLNLLILGRTGVGKSTWINAFVNYLIHPSLDDGLEAESLSWVIPFAFRTYSMTENGEFEDLKVEFGFSKNSDSPAAAGRKIGIQEKDGSGGSSATQRTVVHVVDVGRRKVRLIDTPGIGDTRGAAKDRENLSDILSVLRTYKHVHGILILLKPNEQRLDLMFKFCVQELLTHLHRDAAKNIVFGFTNTRGTNYLPGDTFDPLKQLLQRFEDVSISLRRDTVYCFDSESFRYLAATKIVDKGMGPLQENRASWDYSVMEAHRLLDHFATLTPHDVTSTVNLYETRFQIVCMTRPMASIADTIRSTILMNQDQIKELSEMSARAEGLQGLLKAKVKTVSARKEERPRTTCSHPDCVEFSPTGVHGIDGKEVLNTVYKSVCHRNCTPNRAKLDNIGDDGLRGCWAMQGSIPEHCRRCSHHWMQHLHVDYIVETGEKEIEDPDIKDLITSNASKRRMKEAAIATKKLLVDELESELAKVRKATAQFGIFLKRNAIMPYNDATLDYLDKCIEEEVGKVQAGGSAEKLRSMKQYRKEYEQEVHHLEQSMADGSEQSLLTQEDVEKMKKGLYSLKHYGKELADMCNVIQALPSADNRERAHNLKARAHWTEKRNSMGAERAQSQLALRPAPTIIDGAAGNRPGLLRRIASRINPWG